MENKKRVGIFGGSFNPPTLAHFQVVLEIINMRYADEIWIVPCGDRSDKKVGVDRFTRYRLCDLMLKEISNETIPIKLNDIEVQNGEAMATYDLMNRFIRTYTQYDFFFIMGSDLLNGLDRWRNSKELKKEIKFLIINRTGFILKPDLLPENYILIETTFVGASSTVVRERIKKYYKRQKLVDKKEDKFQEIENGIKNFSKKDWLVKRSNKELDEFHDKYLGVYGVVSFGVIEFIKENNLYSE